MPNKFIRNKHVAVARGNQYPYVLTPLVMYLLKLVHTDFTVTEHTCVRLRNILNELSNFTLPAQGLNLDSNTTTKGGVD